MPPAAPTTALRAFAARQIDNLIAGFNRQMENAVIRQDPDAVHDLRVSIRRLTQTLRTFRSVVPKKEARRVRKALKPLMELAGEIRTRDIALELFGEAGVPVSSAPCVRLSLERDDFATLLRTCAQEPRHGLFDGVRGVR